MEVDNSHPPPPPQPSYGAVGPGTWRCLVCQKPTNQIHILPCQHKFCVHCLEMWAGIYVDMYHGQDSEFPCQVCWKLYVVPDQGMQAYRQDYQVNQLENSLQQMTFGQEVRGTAGDQGPFAYGAGGRGQWDAGTTAEAAFPRQQGAPMQAAMTMQEGSPASAHEDQMQSSVNISDINRDDEPIDGGVQSPGGGTCTSMVSHVAPQTFRTAPKAADYCVRSHHLHMHMV